MKKLYIWMLGAVLGVNGATAQESTDVISEIKVTYENNQRVGGFDFYSNVKLDQNVANYQDGHMDVTMADVNGKYRADIWYNRDSRDNYKMMIDPSKIGVFAIKFIGDKPNGSLKFEWLGDGWTCPGNWTPTGNIKTTNGNTIYYWDLSKVTNYGSAETQQLIRYHFTIADCTVEPYAYTVDWIGSFESLDALTAAKDWKDDGENDMDEYVAPKVINETTGVSYPDLTTAWNEAANDDVILIYEDQTIGRFDVNANTHVTIKGEGDVVIKRKWGHTGLLFCVNQENAVVDIENVTIDGGGVTNSGVSIESSGVNSKVNLKNVVLNEMYSTKNQGLISIKSKASAGVSLENVKSVNCTVPEGRGEIFCGTNNLTLAGDNDVTVYVEKLLSINASDLTNKNKISIIVENATIRDLVKGCQNANRFTVATEGYTLAVNGDNLALCADDEDAPVYVPLIDGREETKVEKELNIGDVFHLTGVKGCTIWYKENAPKTEEVPVAVADVNVNEKEDGWKEVEADEFDYQVPANISSVDFKAVKNGKESGIVTLAAIGGTTAVEVVEAEAEEGVAEYYNLQGVKVENPSEGLYIRKMGNKVSKVIVK